MRNQSDSITKLAAAMAKAQAAVQVASKDATNPHFKSKYADLPAVWEACRKALTANGLCIIQMPTICEPGYAALDTMLIHESGEYISNVVQARLTKDDAQGLGSALTYLRRYSLAAFVGIVADEDDDGNAASGQPAQRSVPPEQAKVEPFAPAAARAAIAALPDATEADKTKAAKLTDRAELLALYNEVAARSQKAASNGKS